MICFQISPETPGYLESKGGREVDSLTLGSFPTGNDEGWALSSGGSYIPTSFLCKEEAEQGRSWRDSREQDR